MTYQAFPYNGFGRGLNLRDKPDAIDHQECIDALNVIFSERGAIVTRGGYDSRVNVEVRSLFGFRNTSGTKRVLTHTNTNLAAYSTTGGSPTATITPSDLDKTFTFARFGTPNAERVYCSNGVNTYHYNGSAFTSPSGFPKGSCLCVQNVDNRLVSTGFLGTTDGPSSGSSSPSHVYFSDPGDPDTWGANNFVQLTPGDGEKVMGAISWRELTFVFKESKFFVFYGNSIDQGGDPVFNYRPVDAGVGLAARHGLTIGPDGVYFVASDGLYRTQGSNPEKVSDIVDPIWNGRPSGYYEGGVIGSVANCHLTTYDQRLYMSFDAAFGQRVLVHDTTDRWFTIYDLPARALHAFDEGLWFAGFSTPKFLAVHNAAFPDDKGTPINAYWRSGWTDFKSPDVKVVRARKMWGVGLTFLSTSTDFRTNAGFQELVDFTVGSQPQWNLEEWNTSTWAEPRELIPKQTRRAVRGTTFSTLIRGNAPWAFHRIDHLVRQVRQPGIERS